MAAFSIQYFRSTQLSCILTQGLRKYLPNETRVVPNLLALPEDSLCFFTFIANCFFVDMANFYIQKLHLGIGVSGSKCVCGSVTTLRLAKTFIGEIHWGGFHPLDTFGKIGVG